MFTKIKSFNLILILITVLLVLLYYQQYNEKKKYESYISEILSTNVYRLASDILLNEQLMNYVVEQENISKDQAELLSSRYSSIRANYQKIYQLCMHLGINDVNNKPADFAQSASGFIQGLLDKNLKTDNKDLDNLRRISEVNKEWKKSINQNMADMTGEGVRPELMSKYFDKSVSKKYWINIMKDLSQTSELKDMIQVY